MEKSVLLVGVFSDGDLLRLLYLIFKQPEYLFWERVSFINLGRQFNLGVVLNSRYVWQRTQQQI